MKKYHLYAMGNALVDIDFEIAYNTLTRLDIDKGVMTLIDAKRELELLEELDGIKHKKACGGSAANTLMTFAKLGGNGFYSCKVANDEAGDYFYQDLIAAGADTNLSANNRDNGVTGKCLVMVTPDADRTMNTHLGITYNFSQHELVKDCIANSDYLYIEGYLVASATAYEAMHIAKQTAQQHSTKIALTLSDLNMVKGFKNEFLHLLEGGIDLLFCNREEALYFCETNNINEATLHLKTIAKQFCITLGSQGVLVCDGNTTQLIPGHRIAAIDTVGAGDIFAGTFLYAITHGHDFFTAGKIANHAAAMVVTKFGPRLDEQHYSQLHTIMAAEREILEV